MNNTNGAKEQIGHLKLYINYSNSCSLENLRVPVTIQCSLDSFSKAILFTTCMYKRKPIKCVIAVVDVLL